MSRLGRMVRKAMALAMPGQAGAVIVGYHRISPPAEAPAGDPYQMCVSPGHFEQHMIAVRELGRPVSLTELGEAVEQGRDVDGWIAVTFDDGYADVALAEPVLARLEIPATVFFIAGGGRAFYWWDVLADLLARADLGIPFRVRTEAAELHWPGSRDATRLRVRLHRLLRVLEPRDRELVLERLAEKWRLTLPDDLPRRLTDEESRRLVASPWIEAGAHTMTHPALAEVSRARAFDEISRCREVLALRFGAAPASFSYPHGSRSRYTDAVVESAGFRFACVSRPGAVRAGAPVRALPRVWAADETGPRFRRRLTRYVGRLSTGYAT